MSLPGRPDMVFLSAAVAVFIDGDFWHGWQFPRWRNRLSPAWKEKIERNRNRHVLIGSVGLFTAKDEWSSAQACE
jgi:G:T-mismatch repair DNA endonuclease (very short patch repair protein)